MATKAQLEIENARLKEENALLLTKITEKNRHSLRQMFRDLRKLGWPWS